MAIFFDSSKFDPASVHIIDSMVNRHGKWLKVCNQIPWRRPIASINYLLSSHEWRQALSANINETLACQCTAKTPVRPRKLGD
jgi:hypothetical protein